MLPKPLYNRPDGSSGDGAPDPVQTNVDQLMNGTQAEATPTLKADASPEEILKFNPFAAKTKGTDVAPDGKKPAVAAPGKGAQPNAQVPPNSAQPAPVQPQSNQPDPAMRAIQELLLRDAEGSGAQPQGQPQGGNEGPDPFKVNWAVPMEIVNALGDENPQTRQLAIASLINGTANGILGMMQERFSEILTQAIPQMLTRNAQVDNLNRTFYGRHPHLQKPELAEMVGRVAKAVSQHRRALGQSTDPASPEFMDAVENYLVANGLAVRPAGSQQQQQQQQQQREPHFGANGARPAGYQEAPREDILASIGL